MKGIIKNELSLKPKCKFCGMRAVERVGDAPDDYYCQWCGEKQPWKFEANFRVTVKRI